MSEMEDTMNAELAEMIRTLEKANSALARIFNMEDTSVGTCSQCNAWDDSLEKGICQTCIREGEGATRCNMCMTEIDSEVTVCPICKVDDYLMDHKREGEE